MVRSQPAQRKDSAVFKRATIRKRRGKVERGAAWIILVLSFVGSMVAFGGGWGKVVTLSPSLAGLGAGFLLQAVLTWLQWAYPDDWRLSWTSRGIDAATTAAGYGPLFYAPLYAWIVAQGASAKPVPVSYWSIVPAVLGTWAILWLVSLFPAWYPERTLIDEDEKDDKKDGAA